MGFGTRLGEIRDGFERPFWVANVSEIFERLSYYGAFSSLAVYLQEKLNFSTEQTGTLTGIFGGMVWFLAIFGGAIADRLGFRRALSLAYLILTGAYFLIGSVGAAWLGPLRNALPLGLFVGCVLILPALGVALGLAGALALSRVMQGYVYGITSTDPLTFAVACLLLTFVAMLASYIPAQRAARVDPMVALRYE